MKSNSDHRKQALPVILAAVISATMVAGCCTSRQIVGVVVPEAVFRTESSITNRIHLPLRAEDRQRVVDFLASGGNRKTGGGSPDEATKSDLLLVEPMLDLLAKRPLKADEIKSCSLPELTKYLGKAFTSQIVDARNYDEHNVYAEPPDGVEWSQFPPWPLAFRHEHIWWIFFPDDAKQITGLMLAAEISREKPNN
jgi:hypothetical protein